jgi:hypothetical protein
MDIYVFGRKQQCPSFRVQEVQNTERESQKKRPNITDPEDPWYGCKSRPKQNRINSRRGKSRDRADYDNEHNERSILIGVGIIVGIGVIGGVIIASGGIGAPILLPVLALF